MITVHWLTQTDAHLPPHNAWMSADEAAVWAEMRFPKRRSEWRLGRWTAKRALVACLGDAGASPAALSIRAAADGAPEVFRENRPASLTLSISHRGGVAFCAVAPEGVALGCDLEKIEPRSKAFVVDYFTPGEQALVAAAAVEDRSTLANLIWSAKESALKALREGLRLDTRRVDVQLSAYRRSGIWRPMRVVYAEGEQVFEGWYRVGEGHVWTLTARPAPGCPVLLEVG